MTVTYGTCVHVLDDPRSTIAIRYFDGGCNTLWFTWCSNCEGHTRLRTTVSKAKEDARDGIFENGPLR